MNITLLLFTIMIIIALVDSNKNELSTIENDNFDNIIDKPSESVLTRLLESSNSVDISIDLPIEQKRLHMIIRSFSKLPESELDRLGITNILDSFLVLNQADSNYQLDYKSPEANLLFDAWTVRQRELAEAMEQIVKPVEHMSSITSVLREYNHNLTLNFYINDFNITSYLIELDALVSDVDNARDFHTIGGWPELIRCLSSNHSNDIRASAALAVGTAVKNNYDYQLWGLEVVDNNTAIDLLIVMIKSKDSLLIRRGLYALGSITRGNLDTQQSLNYDSLSNLLLEITSSEDPVVVAKVYTYILDLIEERSYIQSDLIESLQDNQNIREQVLAINLLGDVFLNEQWFESALQSLNRFALTNECSNDSATRSLVYNAILSAKAIINQSNHSWATNKHINELHDVIDKIKSTKQWDEQLNEILIN